MQRSQRSGDYSFGGGSDSGDESSEGAGRGGGDGEATARRVPVTPAYVRELMPPIEDEDDALFEYHQLRCYRMMETAARNKQWAIAYELSSGDDDVHYAASEAALDAVYARLVHWLRRFRPRPDASAQTRRAFSVTWDPVVAPESVDRAELADATSNVSKRLRWARRALSTSDPSVYVLLRSAGVLRNATDDDGGGGGAGAAGGGGDEAHDAHMRQLQALWAVQDVHAAAARGDVDLAERSGDTAATI